MLAATVAKLNNMQVRGRGGNHSPLTGVPAAETSTHLESAAASHRGATASLLDLLALHHGGFHCKDKQLDKQPAGAWSWRQALSTL